MTQLEYARKGLITEKLQSAAQAEAASDSGVAAAIALLGTRIAQVHLHDNHGPFAHKEINDSTDMKDEHLWPGEGGPAGGTIDWPAASSALAVLPAATPGILEIAGNSEKPAESITRKAEAAFRMFANR